MLANTGERTPPCGVPVLVSRVIPSSDRTPDFRNALTSPTTRRSAIRSRTRASSAGWEISSNRP